MSVKLLNEYNLEFLSLTGDCTGSSESTLVKMPHNDIVGNHMPRLILIFLCHLYEMCDKHIVDELFLC